MKTELLQRIIRKLRLPPWLVEFCRFFAHPRDWFIVWKDYQRTAGQTEWMREHPCKTVHDKKALFAMNTGAVYDTKLFAMLALGLKMKGYRVMVLLSRYSAWAQRYFKLFGIRDFIFWEDAALTQKEKAQCLHDARYFLSSAEWNFQAMKQWKYRGAWIGPQILSTVSRSVMQGAPDVGSPDIQEAIKHLLPETLQTVHRADGMISKISPDLMVVNEANYAMMGALVDTAIQKNVSVIQMTQPSRDDALIFKRLTQKTRRHHPSSVDAATLRRSESAAWTLRHEEELAAEFKNRYGGKWFLQSRNQPGVREKSTEEITRELGLDSHKKTAIVFSHILWDANLFYGEDLFEDYGDWFVQTVKAACANPRLNWIIKLHPANAWKRARENVTAEFAEVSLIKKEIGELPDYVKLLYPTTEISTWSLFQLADYGITVRGTIGMEMPCFGVPVFTAGTGRYSGLGFTNGSATKEEYLAKLAHIEEFDRMTEEELLVAKKHAFTAFRLRPWVMKSFKAEFNYKKTGVHPLDHNLFPAVDSFADIKKNGDLEKFAAWTEKKEEVDYTEGNAL